MNFTVSFENNANAANARKTLTYLDLITDLTQRGWIAKNYPFEIGSWGHINNRKKTFISNIMKKHKIQYNKRSLFQNFSKISLLCSFAISQAHCQPAWQSPPSWSHNPGLHCALVEVYACRRACSVWKSLVYPCSIFYPEI